LKYRYADEDEEKRYQTTVVPDTQNGDQLFIYPGENEDPSPMYQGLRTNLPHVYFTQGEERSEEESS
jgi:hypothetical protein